MGCRYREESLAVSIHRRQRRRDRRGAKSAEKQEPEREPEPITFQPLPWRPLRPVFRRADRLVRFEVDCARGADTNVRARAPVRALTWRGESPRQAEASPVCDRRLLRRGDTGWGAAGGELPVRKERFVKTRNKLNSIRPDGGTSLRALSEVRPVAHASTIGRASPRGGAGQRSNERMLKKTVSERKKLRHRRRVVGDRMAGSVSEISRETCRGTERRSWPERPEEPARQESERP